MDDHQIRDMLARGMRILANEVAPDNRGHVSYRPPGEDRVYIVGRLHVLGRSMASTTYDDIVVIDLDARHLEGRFPAPDESVIHTGVYRARDDVRAVVHVHAPQCISFSIVGQPLVPLSLMPTVVKLFMDGPIPLSDDARLINTPEQGDEIARLLGPSKAILLRGHGVAVVGESIEDAVVSTIELEAAARTQYQASSLGPLRPFDLEAVRQSPSSKGMKGAGASWEVWAYYEEQLNRARGPGDRVF